MKQACEDSGAPRRIADGPPASPPRDRSRSPDLFASLLSGPEPVLALAPMQAVTDHLFWNLISSYGGADVYFTEYFRVHGTSRLDRAILKAIAGNATGCPVVAQLIGNDIPSLVRAARELRHHPVAAIDFNLGCPAPVVYRKCAGGGLLRHPQRIDSILGALRDAIPGTFTVKTRLGFDAPEEFEALLPIFARHGIDLLTVHGRTVREMYHGEVHYDWIARAVAELPCPVLANGNIFSAATARDVLQRTCAKGLMMGRGAIRNPWLFAQIRQVLRGENPSYPTGREVFSYVRVLYETVWPPGVQESVQVQLMKRYMNYLGEGLESAGPFLHQIRRVETESDFFRVCAQFLDHDETVRLEPRASEKGLSAGNGTELRTRS